MVSLPQSELQMPPPKRIEPGQIGAGVAQPGVGHPGKQIQFAIVGEVECDMAGGAVLQGPGQRRADPAGRPASLSGGKLPPLLATLPAQLLTLLSLCWREWLLSRHPASGVKHLA